jgi:hypothetical protein
MPTISAGEFIIILENTTTYDFVGRVLFSSF